ncbi:putative transcriptional regulator [Vibrio parahaemolyticus AQ3810]|nr:putative transcriptional regulator [Vibrio parahaemolyticus AQ3810]
MLCARLLEVFLALPKLEGNFGYVYSVKRRNDPLILWVNNTVESLMKSLGIES